MPRVIFTSNLKRHIDCPPCDAEGNTVKAVLDYVFQEHPGLRSYVLDDQARVRRHIAIFIDESIIDDRENLSDPVKQDSEVFIMQALSGG